MRDDRARWLLLIHQLPAEPAYLRVKIGRRLARVGAVALKNSVYLLPSSDVSREDFSWIRREVVDEGGDATVFEATAVEGLTAADLERTFRDARAKDYDALAREIAAMLSASKPERPQQRTVSLTALSRFEEELAAIERIDFFPAGAGAELRQKLVDARARLERRGTPEIPAKRVALRREEHQRRTWITRTGVKIDRVACAWLITRFIDNSPKFKFVDPARYQHTRNELRFDMPEGEFTHEGDLCSLEVIVQRFALEVPGLTRIAEIVHDLDIKDARYGHPETEGVRVFLEGVIAQHARDEARIQAASTLFDALLHVPSGDAKRKAKRSGGKNGRTQGRAP